MTPRGRRKRLQTPRPPLTCARTPPGLAPAAGLPSPPRAAHGPRGAAAPRTPRRGRRSRPAPARGLIAPQSLRTQNGGGRGGVRMRQRGCRGCRPERGGWREEGGRARGEAAARGRLGEAGGGGGGGSADRAPTSNAGGRLCVRASRAVEGGAGDGGGRLRRVPAFPPLPLRGARWGGHRLRDGCGAPWGSCLCLPGPAGCEGPLPCHWYPRASGALKPPPPRPVALRACPELHVN